MINKDLYMMKVAAEDQYEAPGGSNEDFNIRRYIWEKQHVKDHGRNHYVMYMEPSWATKPEVLKQYNIDYDRTKFMNNSINHIFQLAGENSGLQWSKYDDTAAKKKYNDTSKNHNFYKNHTVIDSLMGVWRGEKPSTKTERDLALAKNELERINLKNKRLDTQQKTYNTDLLQRYTAAITPQRYAELSKLYDDGKMHAGYFKAVSKYVAPYVRDYSNQMNPKVYSATDHEPLSQKTAALAEELNPVPKPKRKRSVFQKFGDTLSTNKAKHVVGVAGGISGMLTGKELLHSNLTPTRALGGVGVIGGAALGAKNIYGLYNDYFN